MAIEERRGNLYYYRKRRDGDRVVSEYVGAGAVVVLEEYAAEQRERERQAQRLRYQALKMSEDRMDARVDGFCDLVDTLLAAALLASGYARHKGEWRKKRDVSKAK